MQNIDIPNTCGDKQKTVVRTYVGNFSSFPGISGACVETSQILVRAGRISQHKLVWLTVQPTAATAQDQYAVNFRLHYDDHACTQYVGMHTPPHTHTHTHTHV